MNEYIAYIRWPECIVTTALNACHDLNENAFKSACDCF